jgi:hypothetical protein
MKTSGRCQLGNDSCGLKTNRGSDYLHVAFVRTKPPKRTRRKKTGSDLKTLYYYRYGRLQITPVDNSGIGLYFGTYVFIKKYSPEKDQFLIEDVDGQKTWTDFIVPIKPSIEGIPLYYTCFEFLARQKYRAGHQVCYRTKNGFAFLRTEHQVCDGEYNLFKNGSLNIDNIPKCYNFALGYSENESIPTEIMGVCCQQATNSNSIYDETT